MNNNKNVLVKESFQERSGKGKKWKTTRTEDVVVSLEQFKERFVEERWEGEKRSDYRQSKLGYFHRKMMVVNPFSESTERTVREFTFGV